MIMAVKIRPLKSSDCIAGLTWITAKIICSSNKQRPFAFREKLASLASTTHKAEICNSENSRSQLENKLIDFVI